MEEGGEERIGRELGDRYVGEERGEEKLRGEDEEKDDKLLTITGKQDVRTRGEN